MTFTYTVNSGILEVRHELEIILTKSAPANGSLDITGKTGHLHITLIPVPKGIDAEYTIVDANGRVIVDRHIAEPNHTTRKGVTHDL